MKLSKYVEEQKNKSIQLRKLASETKNFKRSQELRKQQDKEYQKYLFLKNLNNVKNEK